VGDGSAIGAGRGRGVSGLKEDNVFRTFLPEKGKTNGHRAEALIDTDHGNEARYQVRSRALILSDDSELLRVMLWFRDLGYGELVLNDIGDVVALEVAGRQVDAWTATKAVLDVKGYELVENKFRTLFSPYRSQQNGSRRSARIYDGYEEDEASYQVSAKVVTANNEADELIQLRIWIEDQSQTSLAVWVEVVLNDVADIVAHTVGLTEKDAWKAAQAVCRRKGYEIDA
jgi:hypothetical protein